MKGAIIGFGVIASTGHTPAFLKMKDHQIVAVVDPILARRQAAEKLIPEVKTFASFEALTASGIPLDFIDIATPPCFHLYYAKAAASRGWHVLCEKPITVSKAEAKEMLLAAKMHGVTIFPCHNYKHAPVVKEMKRAMSSGELGDIRSATLATFRTTNAKGTPDWIVDWERMRNYSGGGIVMDHGSHTLYLTFMFFGGHPPKTVSAKTFSLDSGFDTEDNFSGVLSFEKGFAHMHLSWTAGVRKVIYTLQGSRGAIVVDEDDAQLVQGGKLERKKIVSKFDDASHTEWFTSMFQQFTKDIQERNTVTDELRESYFCITTIEAIYQSAQEMGRDVPVDTNLSFLG